MTREEIIEQLNLAIDLIKQDGKDWLDDRDIPMLEECVKALSQEPCDDAISRDAVDKYIARLLSGYLYDGERERLEIFSAYLWELPSVTQKSGKCKNCKYFEYDSVAKVDGIPLIVAHEICNKWGDGCKTKENGYCFLFEPQERNKEWVNFAKDLIPVIDEAESEE